MAIVAQTSLASITVSTRCRSQGGQNKLFLSSAGQLVDATGNLPQAMLNNHGAFAGDIDNDGGLDLLVNALMFDGNFLYLNNGLGVRPVGSSPTGC